MGGCRAAVGRLGAGGSGVQDGGGIPSDIPGEGIGRRFHTPLASSGLARRIQGLRPLPPAPLSPDNRQPVNWTMLIIVIIWIVAIV